MVQVDCTRPNIETNLKPNLILGQICTEIKGDALSITKTKMKI